MKYDDGISTGNRWGIEGKEDLGGGLSAVFVLESGFRVGTGHFGFGDTEFGRQAYVGHARTALSVVEANRRVYFGRLPEGVERGGRGDRLQLCAVHHEHTGRRADRHAAFVLRPCSKNAPGGELRNEGSPRCARGGST